MGSGQAGRGEAAEVVMEEEALWRGIDRRMERGGGEGRQGGSPERVGGESREMVRVRERVGISFGWIGTWHCVAVVVDCLWREEPEFWNRLRRLRGSDSDVKLHQQIEKEMRKRIDAESLDQEEAFRRLMGMAKE